jgi:hypothetical protein
MIKSGGENTSTWHAQMLMRFQVVVQVRPDPGSGNIWHRAGGRTERPEICRQDNPEEECQGPREDGVRRTANAAADAAPSHRALSRLVRVESAYSVAPYIFPRGSSVLRDDRTNTTSSRSSRPVESSLTGSANTASLRRKTPHRRFARSWMPSTICTTTTSSTGVSSGSPAQN